MINRLTVLFCILLLAACAPSERFSNVAPTIEFESVDLPAPEDLPPPALRLGPGDILRIALVGDVSTTEEVTIGIDGMIYYGPGAGIHAKDLTIPELAKRLETTLANFYKNPVVEVSLEKSISRRAIVLGQVQAPGIFTLRGGERLLDLLAMAHGFAGSASTLQSEQLAELSGTLYVRGDKILPVDFEALLSGKKQYNIQVHPGDYMYIPATFDRQIYLCGAFGSPQAIAYRNGMTLVRATAYAGGYTRDAYIDRAIIVRGSLSQPLAGRVDIRAILQGHAPDVPLEPGDIVYLPGRTSENPRFIADQLLTDFVTQLASRYAGDVYDRVDN